MNKRIPVPDYRLLCSLSTKLKLKDNHNQTPCTMPDDVVDKTDTYTETFTQILDLTTTAVLRAALVKINNWSAGR